VLIYLLAFLPVILLVMTLCWRLPSAVNTPRLLTRKVPRHQAHSRFFRNQSHRQLFLGYLRSDDPAHRGLWFCPIFMNLFRGELVTRVCTSLSLSP
jgi:hypothetical protein